MPVLLMRRRRNPVEGRAPSRPWVQDSGHDGALVAEGAAYGG
jgi:hypothetical protein